jgi:hypothetical protein
MELKILAQPHGVEHCGVNVASAGIADPVKLG